MQNIHRLAERQFEDQGVRGKINTDSNCPNLRGISQASGGLSVQE